MKAFTKLAVGLAFFGTVTIIHADTNPSSVPPAAAPTLLKPAMSVADMQASASRLDVEMKADSNQVMQAKELARKQKDIIKLNCVNDRLVQIKAQLNIADGIKLDLQTALNQNNDRRDGLFGQLNDAATAIKTLRGEADACIGAPDLMKQEAGTTVEHPEIPDNPEYTPPFGEEYEPPGYASPFD